MSRDDLRFSGDGASIEQDLREVQKFREVDRNGPVTAHQSEEADSITALLLYLADGYEAGNLAARAAALLLFVRPDLVGARGYRQMAHKLGIGPASLIHAVRLLRQTVPIKGGFQPARTSQTRLLSLGQIQARRRMLWAEHLERMAEARKVARRELAREQVRNERSRTRAYLDRKTQNRLRVAVKTLTLAPHLAHVAAREMADFDRALGIPPVIVSPLAKLLNDSLKKGGA